MHSPASASQTLSGGQDIASQLRRVQLPPTHAPFPQSAQAAPSRPQAALGPPSTHRSSVEQQPAQVSGTQRRESQVQPTALSHNSSAHRRLAVIGQPFCSDWRAICTLVDITVICGFTPSEVGNTDASET